MGGNLFQYGTFKLHSGATSTFKIDCDALTMHDWVSLALMIGERVGHVSISIGVPRGGLKLADCLNTYWRWGEGDPILIVDDVLTTGASMEAERQKLHDRHGGLGVSNEIKGTVLFARGPCPAWVIPLFTMHS